MIETSNVTGAILAGGKSLRMGCDKATLNFHGKPFIAHIAETLKPCVGSVIIISNNGDRYEFLGLPIFGDIYKDCGPLGGIHSTLTNAKTEKVFVVSCDMPLVSRDSIEYIMSCDNRDSVVTVPKVLSRVQPLCGIYKAGCLGALIDYLKRGERSVIGFVRAVGGTVLPLDHELSFFQPLLFADINTIQDYENIKGRTYADLAR